MLHCFRCKRLRCFQSINHDARNEIFTTFYGMDSKDDQDSHLAGLISIQPIKQKRPRNAAGEVHKDHVCAFTYKIRYGGQEKAVCLQAFVSLHGITKRRVGRIQKSLVEDGKSPKDQRGKHANRPNQYPDAICNVVRAHIGSFKARASHYSLRDNPNKKYLPEDLSISTMHKMFIEEYQINLPYKVYWSIFREYNIGFSYPRSDTCNECDSFCQKLNDPSCSVVEKGRLTLQNTIHLKKADAFRTKMNRYKQKAIQGEILCISIDFMQNLPLPHIKSNKVFYCRQLWHYVFGVHNLGTNQVVMFTYHEGIAKKGANEVTSMLLRYITDYAGDSLENLPQHLVLISDSCSGQNKNYVMLHFLYILVHCFKLFTKITYLFPVRGHSYLPNDQDFALVAAKKKKLPSVELPSGWDEAIISARQKPSSFIVHKVVPTDIKNVKEATDPFFTRRPYPPVQIKTVRMIAIHSNSTNVRLRDTYHGPWRDSKVISKKVLPTEIDLRPLYTSKLEINPAKVRDLLSLLPLLSDYNSRQFYEEVCLCSNDMPESDSDGVPDISDDDNSSGCEDG